MQILTVSTKVSVYDLNSEITGDLYVCALQNKTLKCSTVPSNYVCQYLLIFHVQRFVLRCSNV